MNIAHKKNNQFIPINNYQTDKIQFLMLFLSKIDKNYTSIQNNTRYSTLYNPETKTLCLLELNYSKNNFSTQDIKALTIVQHFIGNINFSDCSQLTALDALNNMQSIDGTLTIHRTAIKQLNTLNKIHSIGALIISENPLLEQINGLNALQQITNGNLQITKNSKLTTIHGLSKLQQIENSLILDNCHQLQDIRFLGALTFTKNLLLRKINLSNPEPLKVFFKSNPLVQGYIKIISCQLTTLSFMTGLKKIGSALYLQQNQLQNLTGLEYLESVGKSFYLSSNLLEDISQLSRLTQLNGMLDLASNKLKSLQGLENLKHIKTVCWQGKCRTISLAGNFQLSDIYALSNLIERKKKLIVLLNAKQTFTCIPTASSTFSKNHIQVFSLNFSTQLQTSKVCLEQQLSSKNLDLKHTFYPDYFLPKLPARKVAFPKIKNPIISAIDITDVNAQFVADPFLFKEKNNWYLFYEVMDKDLKRGVIAFSSSQNGLNWHYEKIILQEDFHLSYPYVFKYQNNYYMIPETYQTRSIRLYEAIEFPYRWQFKKTLLRGKKYADASLFIHDNKFWIFTSTTPNTHCYLYYSSHLFNCWKEHPQSPIISDDKTLARSAGRILKLKNGQIIRTSQKCDVRYGQRVRACKVTTLTEDKYQEVELPQSPIFTDNKDANYQRRMHHFDALIDNDTWYMVTDRKGFRQHWCIDLYTTPGSRVYKKQL